MGSLFGLRKLTGLVVFACAFLFTVQVHASAYHDWLVSQQGEDGAILTESSLSIPIQSTHETLKALSLDQISKPTQVALAQNFLASSDLTNTEILARVISAQSLAGSVDGALLSELSIRQNSDGGFGSYKNYESDPLSTAYALQALATRPTTSAQIAKTVGYLLSKRQSDGGWKLDGTSSVALTSEVILALANQTKFSGVSAALAGARAYLINKKKNDNTWGQTFESALALSALATGANTSAELSTSVEAISNRASANNWHSDVYTTALVLQAIKRVNSIGNTTSGKGSIKGQVLVVGSTQPVIGATVSVANTNLQVTTDAQGQFNLVNVPEGSQTLLISKTGFSSTSAVAVVKNAVVTDVGQLVLGQTSSGSIVAGKVFNSGSLVAISGASIELKGAKQVTITSSSSGVFEIAGLPNGNYNFVIDAVGYHKISGSFSLTSGTNVQINQGLVSVDTPLVSEPAALFGKIIDGSTGLPVANAQLVINGSSITANNSGEFTSQPLNRGAHVIQVNAADYISASYNINFPAGAAGNLGSLAIYKATATELPTAVELLATTINSVSGVPISGATITLLGKGVIVTTGVAGSASLTGIDSLSFTLEIAAAGYVTQQVVVTASSFGAVAGTFKLVPATPEESDWSLSGVVRDEISKAPIAGASLSMNAGAFSAITDADGRYQFTNLSNANVTLDVSADNYLPSKQAITLGAVKGAYVVDLNLSALDSSSSLSVISVSAPPSVQPDSTVILNVEVENTGSVSESALVLVKLVNQSGEEVDSLMPYFPGTTTLTPHIDFGPGERIALEVPWQVKQTAAGDYTVRAEIIEAGTMTRDLPRGKVMAVSFDETTVEGIAVFGGALDINPPLTQAGASTPIKLDALLRNNGNQRLDAGQYELKITQKENGSLLHSAIANANALEQNEVADLSFGNWIPAVTQLGEMNVIITRIDGIAGKISGSIYVGDVAKAEFSIDKSVLPEGDSAIKGKIRLTGVDTKLGSSVDPLFVLVKNAVEKGAGFTGPGAITWDKTNKCLGCHIQAQSLASLGAALNKATVDPIAAKYLLNTLTTGQKSNGSLETDHPEYTKTSTLFGAWALSEWPDQQQVHRTQIKALERLWSTRSTGSGTIYWAYDHSTGWLNNNLTATAIAALTAARTIDVDNSLPSIPNDFQWGGGIPYAAGAVGDHVLKSTADAVYVGKSGGRIEKIDVATGTTQIIVGSVAGVSSRLNGLDIDPDGSFWLSEDNGRLLKVSPQGAILKNWLVCSSRTGGVLLNSAADQIYMVCHSQNQLKRVNIASGAIETLASGGVLNNPYGISWAVDGSLLIANYAAANIVKYDPTTSSLSVFADGLKGYPIHIATGADGDAFVTTNAMGGSVIGVHRVRPDATSERILWGNAAWGATNFNGKIYIGSTSGNKLIAVDEVPLNRNVIQDFKTAMPLIAQYLLNNFNIATTDNNLQATALIGFAEAKRLLPEGALKDQLNAKILAIADVLKARQAPNGGWGRTGVATDATRDPLMTALVGIGLEYTSPSSQDPMVRNSITYLLNTQKANGSWHSNTGLFTTDLGTTSLVMVYMPKALDRIGGLDVKLTLDQPANVLLSNPSIAPDVTTASATGGTQYIWDLKGITGNGRDLIFDLTVKDLGLKEIRPVGSAAQFAFANSFTDETITKAIEVPSVTAATEQTLDLQTDKSVYAANEAVQISNLVKNLGPAFNGGKVKLAIHAADNNGLVSELSPLTVNALAVQESQSVATQWNTGTTTSGVYKIHAQLIDSRDRVVAEDSTVITITATPIDSTSLVGATLSSDKQQYRLTETVKLDTTALNLAQNAIQSASLGKLRVVNAQAQVVFERDIAVPQLAINGQFALQSAFALLNVDAGNYQASWQIYNAAGTTLLASANAAFVVVEDPLQALLGTVTVQHPEVDRGAMQQCDFAVTNRGNKMLDVIALKKSVVAVDIELVKDENLSQLSLIASGSESYQQVFGTTAFEKGDYACVLEATVNGQSAVLATALFSVKESPIKLSGDLRLGEKARLLILIDASSSERTYLESLLTNAGWFYTIVDSAAAFVTEMNQGGYGVYALLSEKITLDQSTQTSLNAKVAAGDGLIVAGAMDRRHQTLEQALGIKARANEVYAKGVVIKDSALGLGWQRAFTKSSQVLNFTANGATIIGEYKNDLLGADTQTVLGALGAAGRYGNFVWENFTSLSSTVEGRLAVGGNLSLQNFSVGDKLDPNKLHDVVTVGGNVTFPSGRIYYGNLIAGGSVAGVGDAVRFGMATGAVIKGNTPMPINFAGEREYLQELSTNLATLPANGTVKMQWGGLELKGDCTSSSQVFNVNGADLGVAHTFAVSCIPANATVVFNVSGQSVAIKSMGMQSLTTIRDKVLFNFPQATSLSMTSVGIEGSILAPFAQVNQPAGRVDGQVIVKTWYSTTNGYMSIHNRFFGGDLSGAMGPANKNALSIYQYQQGKSVFAGFDLLAQATLLGASNENPFASLLLAALEQVNPAPITARAGKTLPILVSYENTGAQTASGQVKLVIPANFSVISAANFTKVTNSNDWTAPLALEAGATRTQLLYVKLPQTGGGLLQLQLQTGTSPDWETRAEKSLNLQP
ncbi:choice-of-anchor A family protein [Cellvibrio mixtus]|uniref:choice-of-anchor A family protein n=1 Tax=Cellvibrio mixtus TaxID=39650 RepID=UPI000586925B|nr:choice-of-anchor A family protein [Cellvibrio mixtus]